MLRNDNPSWKTIPNLKIQPWYKSKSCTAVEPL
ncbi:MAG: hypothetical protein ACJA0U_001373 [Salibacteraceae bacterium]|jgi:hypothetical protein